MPGPGLLKIVRHKDRAAIEKTKQDRCEVCGAPAHGDPHHIVTVGAGGPDMEENLVQLCWNCHYGRIPAGKLNKAELFKLVARRMRITAEEAIKRVEQKMGRGIKL